LRLASAPIALVESRTSESLPENRQASASIVDPLSGEVPFKVPPALGSPSKDPKLAEDLTIILLAPSKTLLARESLTTLLQLKDPSGD
jgi:hypothetical protein